VAGFNLGHYQESAVMAGGVRVESFAAAGVESSFPAATQTMVEPVIPAPHRPGQPHAVQVPLPRPKPAGEAAASSAAATIDYLSPRIGAYPYSALALTQLPGTVSQGWPSLVFLSSYAFVPQNERGGPRSEFDRVLFERLMVPHETAHQWWGDSVYWTTYHDRWISEALANYSAMLSFEADDLFFSVLRTLQHDYSRKQMSTRDMQRAFERALPKSLYHEGKPSLDWFFNGWVNGTATPKYQLSNVRLERKGTALRASGRLL